MFIPTKDELAISSVSYFCEAIQATAVLNATIFHSNSLYTYKKSKYSPLKPVRSVSDGGRSYLSLKCCAKKKVFAINDLNVAYCKF